MNAAGLMGSNGPNIDTTSAADTTAMLGASAPLETAAVTGAHGAAAIQAAAAPAAVLALLPAALMDIADSLRALRLDFAEMRAGQHPPPPTGPPAPVDQPPAAAVASKGRSTVQWPASPSPLPAWLDGPPIYTEAAAQPTVQQVAPTFGGPGGFAPPPTAAPFAPPRHPVWEKIDAMAAWASQHKRSPPAPTPAQPSLPRLAATTASVTTAPPSSTAAHHVSAAVRLQAAARGLLARRHVREMRDFQLQRLQVALHGARDLVLVRCVGDLGHSIFPTGGGHAVFSAGSDLHVYDIDSQPAGRRHGVADGSAPRSATAFRRRPPRGLPWSRWRPWDPGGCTRTISARGGFLPHRSESKIKSRSLIRVSLFQVHPLSRDVKGLGRYKSRSLVRLQLEDELRVQVGCSVRVSNGPGPISLKGLLRGQVSLAWESRKPLYIRRGDVSI